MSFFTQEITQEFFCFTRITTKFSMLSFFTACGLHCWTVSYISWIFFLPNSLSVIHLKTFITNIFSLVHFEAHQCCDLRVKSSNFLSQCDEVCDPTMYDHILLILELNPETLQAFITIPNVQWTNWNFFTFIQQLRHTVTSRRFEPSAPRKLNYQKLLCVLESSCINGQKWS